VYGGGPIRVYVDRTEHAALTKQGIAYLNKNLGFVAFQFAKSAKQADVIVTAKTQASAQDYGPGAPTGMEGNSDGPGIVTQGVLGHEIVAPGYEAQARQNDIRSMAHEMGHTIGLQHPGPPNNPYLTTYKKNARGQIVGFDPNAPKTVGSGLMGSGEISPHEEAVIRLLRGAEQEPGFFLMLRNEA